MVNVITQPQYDMDVVQLYCMFIRLKLGEVLGQSPGVTCLEPRHLSSHYAMITSRRGLRK